MMASSQMLQKEPHSNVQSPPLLNSNHKLPQQKQQQFLAANGGGDPNTYNGSPNKSLSIQKQLSLNNALNIAPLQQNNGSPQLITQNVSPPKQAVVHEAFTIPALERKMMFLNEPTLQHNSGHAVDQVRKIWRLHSTQMLNMRKPAEKEIDEQLMEGEIQNYNAFDEIAGKSGFSALEQRPKDFDRFQTSVRNQLAELSRAHSDLRTRFKTSGQQVEHDIERIEGLTKHIQQVFNDFILSFNSFVQREERLETLHHQAIKKSKELSKKIQLEVLAQSSQRSQLLAIVDDLTEQLKYTKATTVKTEVLDAETQAHNMTKHELEQNQRKTSTLEKDIEGQNQSLQQLGQQVVQLKAKNSKMHHQIQSMDSVVEEKNRDIEDLITRRGQLESEVSHLKSQIELTQSSKDKIILKLKQEMRFQAQQTSMINQTMINNTSAYNATAAAQSNNNISATQTSPQQTNNLQITSAGTGLQQRTNLMHNPHSQFRQ